MITAMPRAQSARMTGTMSRNLGGVQSGQHLVEQKELRRGRERPGQFQALAAGHREGVRRPVEQIAETDLASDRLGNAERVGARGVTQIRADQNVVAHRNAAERLHDLEGPGDAAPRQAMRRLAGHVLAAIADTPGARLEESGDDGKERGLAGAVGADQTR